LNNLGCWYGGVLENTNRKLFFDVMDFGAPGYQVGLSKETCVWK
jgi:hypothetical protein